MRTPNRNCIISEKGERVAEGRDGYFTLLLSTNLTLSSVSRTGCGQRAT
jgi:hypothetical protein